MIYMLNAKKGNSSPSDNGCLGSYTQLTNYSYGIHSSGFLLRSASICFKKVSGR